MRAQGVSAFFMHPLADCPVAFAVPDLLDRLLVDVAENGVVIATHRDVAIRVVHLEVRPGMVANELFHGADFSMRGLGKLGGVMPGYNDESFALK